MTLIDLRNISVVYDNAKEKMKLFESLNLSVSRGDFVAIMGPSGSGKSTLLKVISGFVVPESGEVWVDGLRIDQLSNRESELYRNQRLGFIFQDFRLLDCFTALENVMTPMLIAGKSKRESRARAVELLECMGIAHRSAGFPRELSGGEQQRVAIARALANSPNLVLADEPTGNLDSESRDSVLDALCDLHQTGNTILMVTHDNCAAAVANHVISMDSLKASTCCSEQNNSTQLNRSGVGADYVLQ